MYFCSKSIDLKCILKFHLVKNIFPRFYSFVELFNLRLIKLTCRVCYFLQFVFILFSIQSCSIEFKNGN